VTRLSALDSICELTRDVGKVHFAKCSIFRRCILQNFRCGTFRKLHLKSFPAFRIPQNSKKVKSST